MRGRGGGAVLLGLVGGGQLDVGGAAAADMVVLVLGGEDGLGGHHDLVGAVAIGGRGDFGVVDVTAAFGFVVKCLLVSWY